MRRMTIILVFFLLASVCAFAADSELLQTSGQAAVGQKVPWFSGWTVDDQVFNLKKAWADPATKRVALVFWATTCAPCRVGMQRLCQAKAKLERAHVKVVLVNVGEPVGTVRRFLKTHPQKFTVVVDQYGHSKKAFLNNGDGPTPVPRTAIIGRGGKVIRIIGAEGSDYINQIVK
ncbi:MAG: redoxin domain-containing protein [Candidatus Lernaella stagnicola]|nr:redoxin domain-containing protein [Candidatus Lernaella stagnicola]